MRFIKTASFLLSIGLLAGCGSDSDSGSKFEGKFTTDQLSGLYNIGGFLMRFDETEEGDQVGYTVYSGLLYESQSTASPSDITEDFNWDIDVDGVLSINYPILGSQTRITLTEGDNNLGKVTFERDLNLDDDFESIENDVIITKVTPDGLTNKETSFSENIIGDFTLYNQTPEGTINYSFSENIVFGDYKLGSRNGETILWDVFTEEDNNSSITDQSYLIGRIIIVRLFFGGVQQTGAIPVEIISLTSGNENNGGIQYLTDLLLTPEVAVTERKFPYITNDATWTKNTEEE